MSYEMLLFGEGLVLNGGEGGCEGWLVEWDREPQPQEEEETVLYKYMVACD